jgi:osmotically-inducible protein OsmY
MDHSCAVGKSAEECLRESPYTAIRNLSCEGNQGVVVLRGQVPTYYEKQLAQETVAQIDGTMQIINEVDVMRQRLT